MQPNRRVPFALVLGAFLGAFLALAPGLHVLADPLCEGPGQISKDATKDVPEAPAVDIPNVKTPGKGLLTGGQPTEAQLAEMAEAGYRTVINLRTEGEHEISDREAEIAERLGMRYVHLPVAGAEGLTEENVRALRDLLDDEEIYPVVVHCGSGNRVGALFALKAFYFECHNGEEAIEAGKAAGLTRLEPVVREKLGVEDKTP